MPIVVKNVSHTYMPGTPFESLAVDDVSFTVNDGEFLGIIGHTGSGKSTLIQHLNGLIKPDKGSVSIDGVDIAPASAEAKAARRRVGLVFQYPEYQLFEETVLKDISFGPLNLGLSEEEAHKRAEEAAILVGLGKERLDKSPFDLSGGMKRRCAIAGVLAMDPDYLILDEPAAGLDPSGRRGMESLLRTLHTDKRKTLVMVSHSMEDVAKLCDRIIVMRSGRIFLEGAPAEIFRRRDLLTDAGLDLPAAEILADKLREKGFIIPEGIYDSVMLAHLCAEQIHARREAKMHAE